jgi:hypothetical protein
MALLICLILVYVRFIELMSAIASPGQAVLKTERITFKSADAAE